MVPLLKGDKDPNSSAVGPHTARLNVASSWRCIRPLLPQALRAVPCLCAGLRCETPSGKTYHPAHGASCRAVPEVSIGQSYRRNLGQATLHSVPLPTRRYRSRWPVASSSLWCADPYLQPAAVPATTETGGRLACWEDRLHTNRSRSPGLQHTGPNPRRRRLCLQKGLGRRGNEAIPRLPAEEQPESDVRAPLRDKRASACRSAEISDLPGER